MPSKIRVLSDQTINQIAAGEVIENPASVVKELVENSLDAGATEISIEIAAGGRQLIRVRDNGCGMSGDDALLCLERHATSKIQDVNDLNSLLSMGFRGEAIPSIASISKFTLMTAEAEKKGTLLLIEGGKTLKCAEVDCAQGTQIEVKELFFNVPARKKFQKSPVHDTQEILKCVTLLALGNPTIQFQLISNQKTVLDTKNTSRLQERIAEVLGEAFLQETCPFESDQSPFHLEGVIGLPACTRHNRSGQFLFINRRAVFSPFINYVVREGYGHALPQNRHPIFVLHLSLPGSFIDVNVHPQKREVRLRQEQTIKEWIVKAVQGAISHTPEVSDLPAFTFPTFLREPGLQAIAEPAAPTYHIPPSPKHSVPELFMLPAQPKKIIARVVATLPGVIVAEMPPQEGLTMIDQRAAHARIIFEKLDHQTPHIQTLLIPYTLELTPLESSILKQHLESLNKLGIGIKEFGGNAFAIDSIPQIFGNVDLASLLHELLNQMRDWEGEHFLQQHKCMQIAQAASRTAVSRSRKLSLEEAQRLVNQLMECQTPDCCPQGKPTQAHLSLAEMTKSFGK